MESEEDASPNGEERSDGDRSISDGAMESEVDLLQANISVPRLKRQRAGKDHRSHCRPTYTQGNRLRAEGSRKSAREFRARRKMRYQYVEEMVMHRERAIQSLRHELEMWKKLCAEMDEGRIPKSVQHLFGSSESSG